jgi:hypothetical protein
MKPSRGSLFWKKVRDRLVHLSIYVRRRYKTVDWAIVKEDKIADVLTLDSWASKISIHRLEVTPDYLKS